MHGRRRRQRRRGTRSRGEGTGQRRHISGNHSVTLGDSSSSAAKANGPPRHVCASLRDPRSLWDWSSGRTTSRTMNRRRTGRSVCTRQECAKRFLSNAKAGLELGPPLSRPLVESVRRARRLASRAKGRSDGLTSSSPSSRPSSLSSRPSWRLSSQPWASFLSPPCWRASSLVSVRFVTAAGLAFLRRPRALRARCLRGLRRPAHPVADGRRSRAHGRGTASRCAALFARTCAIFSSS